MAPRPPSRALLLKLALVGVILAVGGLLVLRGLPVRSWLEASMAWVRGVGPVPFLAAMVLFPAFGFPMLAFTASAGTLFSDQFGWPAVVAGMGVGLAGNLTLTYWLARRGLRPLLTRVVEHLGYRLPEVASEDHAGLTLLVRVAPGPPFFVQSYLLGLAEVRFRTYIGISWAAAMCYAVALAYFGDGLLQGEGKAIFIGLSLLVGLAVGVKWLRRVLARKRQASLAQS